MQPYIKKKASDFENLGKFRLKIVYINANTKICVQWLIKYE